MGQDARNILDQTAAGDVRHPLDREVFEQIQEALDIDAGRGEELFTNALFQTAHRAVDLQSHALEENLARQRITVGMEAGGGETDNLVANRGGRTVNDILAIDNADGKTSKIVLPFAVHSRHLGGLAANQSTAGLDAALGDAANNLYRFLRREFARRQIVEEEEGLGALNNDIVDAHRHQIDADRIVLVHHEGDLELGADTIGRRDQSRLLVLSSVQREETAKAAEVAHDLRTIGRLDQRFDHLHKAVTGININAGIFIGHGIFLRQSGAPCRNLRLSLINQAYSSCQRQRKAQTGRSATVQG